MPTPSQRRRHGSANPRLDPRPEQKRQKREGVSSRVEAERCLRGDSVKQQPTPLTLDFSERSQPFFLSDFSKLLPSAVRFQLNSSELQFTDGVTSLLLVLLDQ